MIMVLRSAITERQIVDKKTREKSSEMVVRTHSSYFIIKIF